MGPVVGFAGALMADLALRSLSGDASATGSLFTYDGKTDTLREVGVERRRDCALCGESPSISRVEESRYTAAHCAA
jgi:hypothetical protein